MKESVPESASRRSFLRASLTGLVAAGAGGILKSAAALAGPTPGRKSPNLLFIFPDQLRVQALGFMNADPVVTPNIDRFASQGVIFTNAVSNRPVCSPFRGMLFTGRWPYSTGIISNCNSRTPDIYLRESERCIGDVLKAAGYSCGYIGKWHLDTPEKENYEYTRATSADGVVWDAYTPPGPRRHGFDFWYSYGCFNDHLSPRYWVGNAKVDQLKVVKEWSVKHEADVAVDYIRNRGGRYRDRGKPFALFVAMNPPHPPFPLVPDEYRAIYRGKTPGDLLNRPNLRLEGTARKALRNVRDYFAAISGVDLAFKRVLDAIGRSGLEDDTIVVFASDHGEMMGSHGLRGKVVYYEESFRIPLIIRYPRLLKPRRDGLHINVPDYMPTLLGLMGLRDGIPPQAEGIDYSDAVLGKAAERPRSTFYLRTTPAKGSGSRGVRTDRYTFVINKSKKFPPRVLFDNENDPYQVNNIVEDRPAVAGELTEELNRWLRKTDDIWDEV